jgi:hypothetical protein
MFSKTSRKPLFNNYLFKIRDYAYVTTSFVASINCEADTASLKDQKHLSLSSAIRLYISNVVVEWLTLLLRTWEVPVSNFGPETGYPD